MAAQKVSTHSLCFTWETRPRATRPQEAAKDTGWGSGAFVWLQPSCPCVTTEAPLGGGVRLSQRWAHTWDALGVATRARQGGAVAQSRMGTSPLNASGAGDISSSTSSPSSQAESAKRAALGRTSKNFSLEPELWVLRTCAQASWFWRGTLETEFPPPGWGLMSVCHSSPSSHS